MIHSEQIIRFYTTPEELRQLADEMEERYKALKVGDSKEITRRRGDGVTVVVLADQEKMGDPEEYEGSV